MRSFIIANQIFLLITFSNIFANDTEMGSFGYNLVAMQKSKVQMVKEIVYIEIADSSYYYKVHCKFWFYNHDKTTKLDVGFPDFYYPESDWNDNYKPIVNFKSTVNGQPVKVDLQKKISKIEKNSGYNNDTLFEYWYIKTIEFPANDTVVVENYYECEMGGSIHPFASENSIHYVIGTGSSWYGNIVVGKIIFDYTNFRSSDFISSIKSSYFKDTFEIISKINIQTSENVSVFSFNDYKPNKQETLYLEFYKSFHFEKEFFQNFTLNTLPDYYLPLKKDFKKNLCVEKIDRIKKEILAREGYNFKNINDSIYFNSKPWYKPKPENQNKTIFEKTSDELKDLEKFKKYVSNCKKSKIISSFNEIDIMRLKDIYIFK